MGMTGYWLHAEVAREILRAMDRGDERIDLSPDLNLSRRTFILCGDELILDEFSRLNRGDLRQVEGKENRIFYL
jgi:hypothetical protein